MVTSSSCRVKHRQDSCYRSDKIYESNSQSAMGWGNKLPLQEISGSRSIDVRGLSPWSVRPSRLRCHCAAYIRRSTVNNCEIAEPELQAHTRPKLCKAHYSIKV